MRLLLVLVVYTIQVMIGILREKSNMGLGFGIRCSRIWGQNLVNHLCHDGSDFVRLIEGSDFVIHDVDSTIDVDSYTDKAINESLGGLPCKLEGIVESPLIKGYRNKCEFSVGFVCTKETHCRILLGNFREGITAVEEPVDCPNVSQISCKLASIFQDYLQYSVLPVWNRIDNTEFWRQLMVREGRNPGQDFDIENFKANISEVMVMVQVHESCRESYES